MSDFSTERAIRRALRERFADSPETLSAIEEILPLPKPETCASCGNELVFELPSDPWPGSYQRALVIVFHGGYGMFIDPVMGERHEAVLCHACAHALCDANRWVERLLDPAHGHSHT